MKKIFLIMLIFFVSGCGYSPIYKNQSQNFQINIETMDGDSEFNNFIKDELKLYSNLSSQKIYPISINSDYKKIDIAKDTSGVASNYKLSILANISVKLNNGIKNFQFKETINIKNNTNSFEQKNYERNIKRNFASLIREKLIIKLLNINDN